MEANNGMDDRGGGYTLQPHSLGTLDKCPHAPKFPSVLWDWGRGHKLPYILAISYYARKRFLGHSQPLGGRGHVP